MPKLMEKLSLAIRYLSSSRKRLKIIQGDHELLLEVLWAHRISRHDATKVTPYELVYGQEANLPVEVNLNALRITKQNDLSTMDFYNLMMDNIDEVVDKRFAAFQVMEKDK